MQGPQAANWRTLPCLVTTQQLSELLAPLSQKYPPPRLLDGTWLRLPIFKGRDAAKEFCDSRIPSSLFCDIDEVCDKALEWPHMMERDMKHFVHHYAPQLLLQDCRQNIVCYDRVGVFTACRVKWMLGMMGFQSVGVLQGGWKAWKDQGLTTEGPISSPEVAVRLVEEEEANGPQWKDVTIFDETSQLHHPPPPLEQQLHFASHRYRTRQQIIQLLKEARPPLDFSKPLLITSELEEATKTTFNDSAQHQQHYQKEGEKAADQISENDNCANARDSKNFASSSRASPHWKLPMPLVDTRSWGRFSGTAPEPREGLPSGHIPGAMCLPFTDVLNSDWSEMLPPSQLRDIFTKAGLNMEKLTASSSDNSNAAAGVDDDDDDDDDDKVILMCGSGASACIVDVALESCGVPPRKRLLYDGSWTEWAFSEIREKGEGWQD